jgi:phosphohistidine swiveling domain-containing protein
MMAARLVWDLRNKRLPPTVGGKARNLHLLANLGVLVPHAYVISWEAYQRYAQNDETVVTDLRRELSALLRPNRRYAVRSSANIEDQIEDSFAGQFKSVLDCAGIDAVLQAVWSIWATARSPRIQEYLAHKGGEFAHLQMGVIVQDMVNPVVSGVSFSKNPLNGLNEVIIEAVQGSGEALVQSGATPFRWVYRWGEWAEKAVDSPLPGAVVADIVSQTRRLAFRMKKDLDLEWVYDGEALYWVQAREITSLKDLNIYSNRISREVLPGLIKPLIWSVNVPLVNRVWIDVLTELVGENSLKPEELAKAFYYRAYFNMGKFGQIFASLGLPPESLERLMGLAPAEHKSRPPKMNLRTLIHVPRMLRFAIDKARFSRKVDAFLPDIQSRLRIFPIKEASSLDESGLLRRIGAVMNLAQETAYYNIIIPLALNLYTAMLRRQLSGSNIAYEDLDLLRSLDEIEAYDPNVHLRKLKQAFLLLDPALQSQLKANGTTALETVPGLSAFRSRFKDLLERFGHLSDSGNDFSSTPWRERPESILQLVIDFPEASEQAAEKIEFDSIRLPAWKKWVVHLLYRRARQYSLYREQVSSVYTYVYGLLRVYYLALADRLARRGLLIEPGDIFYLEKNEVRLLVEGGQLEHFARDLAAQRRREMEEVRAVVPPETIFGDQPPPVHLALGERLEGVPASRGYHTGPVAVVQGLADFAKVLPGAVLVIPFSDVGWTPLFARAGAVISESGGLLAHASIIAREYGIPAVVSVPNATRLPDGAQVTVDGFRGEVMVHK